MSNKVQDEIIHPFLNFSGATIEVWECVNNSMSRRCSKYIFILDITPGFNRLGNNNGTTGRETLKLWDLLRLLLGVWRYLRTARHSSIIINGGCDIYSCGTRKHGKLHYVSHNCGAASQQIQHSIYTVIMYGDG